MEYSALLERERLVQQHKGEKGYPRNDDNGYVWIPSLEEPEAFEKEIDWSRFSDRLPR